MSFLITVNTLNLNDRLSADDPGVDQIEAAANGEMHAAMMRSKGVSPTDIEEATRLNPVDESQCFPPAPG